MNPKNIWSIVNSEQKVTHIFEFFKYILRRWIAEPYGNSVSCFWKNCHMVFTVVEPFFMYSQRYTYPHVHCSIIHSDQYMETTKGSIEDWIKKAWHRYMMEYCSATRKDEVMPCATTWMDLENIMLSEISQPKKLSTICFHPCGI